MVMVGFVGFSYTIHTPIKTGKLINKLTFHIDFMTNQTSIRSDSPCSSKSSPGTQPVKSKKLHHLQATCIYMYM